MNYKYKLFSEAAALLTEYRWSTVCLLVLMLKFLCMIDILVTFQMSPCIYYYFFISHSTAYQRTVFIMDQSKIWFPREQAPARSASGWQDKMFALMETSEGIV